MTDHDKLREALQHVHRVFANQGGCTVAVMADDLRILRDAAESTLPKTKMVEVWRVEFAGAAMGLPYIEQDRTREEAEQQARKRRSEGATCVKVTGPHMQEVPDGR